MVVIGRDITGRKQIEEALIEAEAKYRNLVERALVGVYIYQENTYQYVNPRYAEIFGYTVDELLKLSPLDLLQNGEKKQWIENFHKRISGDNNSLHYQIKGLKKDGSIIECEVHGTVTIYKGKPAIVGTLLDITERKKTEEILRKTDKLSIVSELAAGIAHEIRNPLTSLKGFVQLLKEESHKNKFYYEIMLSELERINSIVSEFLILSKPQYTNYEVKDLIQIITSVVTLLESEAHKNNVQILTAFDLDNVQINCVESQLKQVFINVLKNAMEAMPSGGDISVHVELDKDGYVRIKFVDQGCGIPASRISKLGEPFYTTKEKGTGLGLMVSYKIIENHFGKIKIKSEENKGTTVGIELPVGLFKIY
ncbi:PAS domain S-box protein [Aneurinibacillus sp. Ricciae_BoGa-3]|uniref:ATP-binding protein n=1 Tax=Aneurinibacillus sp. Ricciae_BoGa-3 TaxID=3022697 RepID=UPI0023423B94|nr:ATP-binding protein [Aneurinibacillus sp. Ricciae_BoGa-3]WCK52564.1 PAS domain S-box protein [Aneurinibacillus sp. Ricciae_BoGa-3]